MPLHYLTNVPSRNSGLDIRPVVSGQTVRIVRCLPGAKPDDGALMTVAGIPDHMLARPDDLRLMVGSDLATAIRMARDAGYDQALATVRAALGL